MARSCRDWDASYQTSDTPWDSGRPSAELRKLLEEMNIRPCRALELGCGTGTNALFLAQQGFDVTGVDLSPTAIETACRRAQQENLPVQFEQRDLLTWREPAIRWEFLFDRGCYHCLREPTPTPFLDLAERLLAPGGWYISLIGRPDPEEAGGPPRVTEDEIRWELGERFQIVQLRPFRFEDAGGVPGPAGWSVAMRAQDLA